MDFSFNYYHQLDDVELYLCNPDGRELYVINAQDRKVTLRFNDLSNLTFTAPSQLTQADGTIIEEVEYYKLLETMRLIYATNIGWFKITAVSEDDSGTSKYKTVEAQSLQVTFKDKGFITEERVYKFYDEADPRDELYLYSNKDALPSVVGQLYQQLGIELDIRSPIEGKTYNQWTITYISPILYYKRADGGDPICRTFLENTTYGYDWMVNEVEEAFKVVFIFDYMHRSIQIKTISEVTQRANLCLSFNNFMRDVKIEENSEDIVTVLTCNGNGIDITQVNPTGTNYIVDFSYYMDDINHKWMSDELIVKLKDWKNAVDVKRDEYVDQIKILRSQYLKHTQLSEEITMLSTSLQDLKNARDKVLSSDDDSNGLTGTVTAEVVKINCTSYDKKSNFYTTPFSSDVMITAYKDNPGYYGSDFTLSGESKNDTATNNYNDEYRYFFDSDDHSSYCRLEGAAKISVGTEDENENMTEYYCDGFTRFIPYSNIQEWISLKEELLEKVQQELSLVEKNITQINDTLGQISKSVNILSYFANTPDLFRELSCYWIEGEYANDNIAYLETTTEEEAIALAQELLSAGEDELSKVSQPRFSFSLNANNALRQYEFRNQASELKLGKLITIEKEDGLWYYPALLEMSFSLENKDDFSLSFANGLRLDDWGYTYGDLISSAASTSRQVSANWHNLMSYSRDKDALIEMINNPSADSLIGSLILSDKIQIINQEDAINATVKIRGDGLIIRDDKLKVVRVAKTNGTLIGSNAEGIICDELVDSLSDIEDKYDTFFNALKPVVKTDNNKKMQIIYSSENVKAALSSAGIEADEFGDYFTVALQDTGSQELYPCLRYAGFIPLNTYEIQRIKKRLDALETPSS